jgi:NTP pyrophosphatase (non-canonical NTP hydrolase)
MGVSVSKPKLVWVESQKAFAVVMEYLTADQVKEGAFGGTASRKRTTTSVTFTDSIPVSNVDFAVALASIASSEAIEQAQAEVARATAKFPTWPTDPLHALAVLGEEYGELTKAVLQHTYEPHKSTLEDVRQEAIQTAAMALRFLSSLDKYEYRQCPQHSLTAGST